MRALRAAPGGRGYALEFQDGRDRMQQGDDRQCRESIGTRQGSVEIGGRKRLG